MFLFVFRQTFGIRVFFAFHAFRSWGQKYSQAFHQRSYYIDFIDIFIIINISLSCPISVGTAIAANTNGIIPGSR